MANDEEAAILADRHHIFHAAYRAFGSGDPGALLGPTAPTTTVPWPSVGRRKHEPVFTQSEEARVHEAIRRQPPEVTEVDPRRLYATQPGITRQHLGYYMGGEYERTGHTSADTSNVGNRYPVVLMRLNGQSVLLSGHHRAAAALLKGKPLRAIRVQGD